ncbi:CD82 antigen [Austrofundulus limnaeus]|uniref:CD82 antigen n=1 Tax=Austrofundulus limnaeus TaxID=52670 RepID=A0A2I4CZB2_AUSLI|nr:PREDICTED: CD82 antigen-like [Austrofundulus limnaeus]
MVLLDRTKQNLLVEMKLQVKIELLKFCFAVLNSVFLVLGLSVLGCAVWILFDRGTFLNVLSSGELQVVAAGLFLIGAVVVLVGVSGCVAASRELRFLLLVFTGLIIILVLGQLFVGLVLMINKNKIEKSLDQAVDQIIFQYGEDNSVNRLLDSVQRGAACCGRNGPEDWLNNSFIKSLNLTSPDVLPCSCLRNSSSFGSLWCSNNSNFTQMQFGQTKESLKGCSQTLIDWLWQNILTIIMMDVCLILLQVALASIAVKLFQMFGEKVAFKRTNQLVAEDDAHPGSAPDGVYGEQNLAYMDPDGGLIETEHMSPEETYNLAQNQVYLGQN